MMFFIHFKDGHRETYISHYDEEKEEERGLAWEGAYMTYPEAAYIEFRLNKNIMEDKKSNTKEFDEVITPKLL